MSWPIRSNLNPSSLALRFPYYLLANTGQHGFRKGYAATKLSVEKRVLAMQRRVGVDSALAIQSRREGSSFGSRITLSMYASGVMPCAPTYSLSCHDASDILPTREPNSEGGLVQNVLSPRQSLRGLIASRLWVIKRYKLGGN